MMMPPTPTFTMDVCLGVLWLVCFYLVSQHLLWIELFEDEVTVGQRVPQPYAYTFETPGGKTHADEQQQASPEPEAEASPGPEAGSETADTAPPPPQVFTAFMIRYRNKMHLDPKCDGTRQNQCTQLQERYGRGKRWCLICARHLQE